MLYSSQITAKGIDVPDDNLLPKTECKIQPGNKEKQKDYQFKVFSGKRECIQWKERRTSIKFVTKKEEGRKKKEYDFPSE